jgi:hypothetical protein
MLIFTAIFWLNVRAISAEAKVADAPKKDEPMGGGHYACGNDRNRVAAHNLCITIPSQAWR